MTNLDIVGILYTTYPLTLLGVAYLLTKNGERKRRKKEKEEAEKRKKREEQIEILRSYFRGYRLDEGYVLTKDLKVEIMPVKYLVLNKPKEKLNGFDFIMREEMINKYLSYRFPVN